jgi:hypothetical protein
LDAARYRHFAVVVSVRLETGTPKLTHQARKSRSALLPLVYPRHVLEPLLGLLKLIYKNHHPCPSEEEDPFVRRSASSAISLQSFARWKNLPRISGLVVVIAVRWHSIAFLRHSLTGAVSLDDLFKLGGVMCHDEQDDSDATSYHAALDPRLKGDFQFDLNSRDWVCCREGPRSDASAAQLSPRRANRRRAQRLRSSNPVL